jgi:outer membrane protein OmpA-like peptidoglycan-associated protein
VAIRQPRSYLSGNTAAYLKIVSIENYYDMIRMLMAITMLMAVPSFLMADISRSPALGGITADRSTETPHQRDRIDNPLEKGEKGEKPSDPKKTTPPKSTPRRDGKTPPKTGPQNLGPKVNSYASELLPVISPDGRTLYFVRGDHAITEGDADDQDIWYAERDRNGQWSEPIHMSAPLNTTAPNGVMAVTPDGNSLLLNGTYSTGKGFSITHRTPTGWSNPRKLEIRNYYNSSRYVAAYLANDARTLILTVGRRDSRGGMDLYVSRLEADGTWSEPMSLGPTVNTEEDENAPFLASDGVTLYFASEGRRGEGSADIYMSRRLDDTWKNWSEPVNLGPTINTPEFETGFFLPASGDSAYYASSMSGQGATDLFRIEVPAFARPLPVVLVSGRVLDQKTGKPLGATIVYETLADGKRVGVARSDPKTGAYKITLPAGANYGFNSEASGYIAVSDNLDLSSLTRYSEQQRDLYMVPVEVGQSIRLNNLFFDFNKATLRQESFSELSRLIEAMGANPTMEIEIAGHTDAIGTADRNLKLSQERATTVAEYLVGKGIPESRLSVKGYGATKPIGKNTTDEGRQLNRRVEVVIRKK